MQPPSIKQRFFAMATLFFIMMMVGGVVAAATFQGTQNPYGKGVTVTIPAGTYAAYDAPTSTGAFNHTGDAGITGNLGVVGAIRATDLIRTDGGLQVGNGAAIGGDAGVTGVFGAAGGLVVGTSGTKLAKILVASGTVGASVGADGGSCLATQPVSLGASSGISATGACFLNRSKDINAAGYTCLAAYAGADGGVDYADVTCCCPTAAACAIVAPATMNLTCIQP